MIPVTALIPTSPIPSHPSTEIIEETVTSIRERVECDILIMCDGVRPEQHHLADQYQEYLRRLILLCNRRWEARPILYPWLHQAGITKATLPLVGTSTFLFVEHDTPLVGDIPFDRIVPVVESGAVNLVRFYHEAAIHPEHEHLMIGTGTIENVPLTFTRQYSQRPFVAHTDWYRRMLKRFFPAAARTMIEDRVHSPAQTEPWGEWRLAVYTPEGIIKRSTHTDGRGDESKYEMRFE